MIEHRHSKRVEKSEKISIYHRGTFVADCKIKDISTDGMALWAGPLQYHRNTMLEVEFSSPRTHSQESVRIPAIVVYSATKVLGLMFTQVNELALQSIRQIVNTAGNRSSKQSKAGQSWEKVMSSQPA
ncbi:PilZ domain-containing protein [Kaarinaea lacus]